MGAQWHTGCPWIYPCLFLCLKLGGTSNWEGEMEGSRDEKWQLRPGHGWCLNEEYRDTMREEWDGIREYGINRVKRVREEMWDHREIRQREKRVEKEEAEDITKGKVWESIVKNMRKGENVEKLKWIMMKWEGSDRVLFSGVRSEIWLPGFEFQLYNFSEEWLWEIMTMSLSCFFYKMAW